MKRALGGIVLAATWLLGLGLVFEGLRVLGHGALALPRPTIAAVRLWLTEHDAVTVGIALVRAGCVLLTGYLAATSTAALLGHALRLPALVRAADLASVPPVRKLVGGLLSVTLGVSPASVLAHPGAATAAAATKHAAAPADPELASAARAGAATLHAAPGRAAAGRPGADHRMVEGAGRRRPLADRLVVERLPDQAEIVMERLADEPAPVLSAPRPTDITSTAIAPPAVRTWTIRRGDHLWAVAATSLARAWQRPATEVEVTDYWHRVIEHNRTHLADPHNPDLVFAGQDIELPPIPPDLRAPRSATASTAVDEPRASLPPPLPAGDATLHAKATSTTPASTATLSSADPPTPTAAPGTATLHPMGGPPRPASAALDPAGHPTPDGRSSPN